LQQNGLLEIKIQMSGTAGPMDHSIRSELAQERFSAGIVDFVTASADPRPNGGEHTPRRDVKGLTHQRDGGGHDLRRDAFSPGVYNAHGRQTRSSQDDGEAICRDDTEGKTRAIGDQAIRWRALHALGISRFGQDNHPIAMHLSECREIVGINADCLTKSGAVPEDACAAVAAAEPQVERGIGRLTHPSKAGTKGMYDESMGTQRSTV
jgi:hypothetical protein